VGVLVGTPLAKGYEKGELTPFGQAPKLNPYGKKYPGVTAFCFKRQQERNFRIDRILEMEVV